MTKTIFLIFLLLALNSAFAEGELGRKIQDNKTDSILPVLVQADYPNLRAWDSLYSCGMMEENIHPWEIAYQFDSDSIPTYLDTTYAERLRQLDIKSPFSFEYNESVRSMIMLYSSHRPGTVARALIAKDLYFPLFEELLDKYQLPLELKYLAIVESALNPTAVSRAGAVGLWQFMPGTGKMYGLRNTSIVDDRMDIFKSTEAACQHFRDLYEYYHDWNLVLAAYNAGSGNVDRAIKKSGGLMDYWKVRPYLPRETQNYVPAFVAVNYIMQFADAHNISPRGVRNINYFTFDTLYVSEKLTFNQIADWLEMDVQTIAQLNPQYRKKYIAGSPQNPAILMLPYAKIGEFIRNKELIISGVSRNEFESQAAD
jgi:membrane-bound lytic murein transglycosylase D